MTDPRTTAETIAREICYGTATAETYYRAGRLTEAVRRARTDAFVVGMALLSLTTSAAILIGA